LFFHVLTNCFFSLFSHFPMSLSRKNIRVAEMEVRNLQGSLILLPSSPF
jgi:hypothetical protein